MTTGEKIKQFRINKGLNQSELAQKSGISRISIGYYERNERQPGTEQVERLAAALDVSPVDIMGWGLLDNEVDTARLRNELEKIRQFESYLSSLGYTVKTTGDGERCIVKGKAIADFDKNEFGELQAKFFELQKQIEELKADNQAVIEARIRKKAKK